MQRLRESLLGTREDTNASLPQDAGRHRPSEAAAPWAIRTWEPLQTLGEERA
jgi:hypothetical protein